MKRSEDPKNLEVSEEPDDFLPPFFEIYICTQHEKLGQMNTQSHKIKP